MTDQQSVRLCYPDFSGSDQKGATGQKPPLITKERIGRLLMMHANNVRPRHA
jgi:hypothetical protein